MAGGSSFLYCPMVLVIPDGLVVASGAVEKCGMNSCVAYSQSLVPGEDLSHVKFRTQIGNYGCFWNHADQNFDGTEYNWVQVFTHPLSP